MANALQQSNVFIVVYNSIFLSDFMLIITRYTHIVVKVKTLNKHSESGFCKTKHLFSNKISNYANVKKSKLT